MTDSQAGTSPVDVAGYIDQQPVGGFQIKLLLTCAAVLFLDGFDTQAIGYVAPALAKEWGLTKAALGPVFSAGLFGLMIGALVFGPLADRIGRKKIIILSTLAFGIGTLATAFINDVNTLLLVRFLTGLGLGGAMPNAVAMTSEFSPHRRRATMVMIMFCGFSIGAALGGLLAAALIPQFGWRSVFIVGGVAPLLLVPILALRLPESVRFLALTGQANARVAELLASINPKAAFAPATQFVVHEPGLAGMPVLHLFKEGRTLPTLLLWVVFFNEPARPLFPVELVADRAQRPRRFGFLGRRDRVDAAGGWCGRHLCARQRDRPLLVPRAGVGVFCRGVRGRRDWPARPFRRPCHHGDLRCRLLHRWRPDRGQRPDRGILSNLGQVDRRRLGAWHRADRLDHRPAGRRRAFDGEMEYRIGVHGSRHGSLLRGAGGLLAEPVGRHERQQGRRCALIN